MSIDVFLRWYPRSPLRQHFAATVAERVTQFKDTRLVVLKNDGLSGAYHIESKRYAEEHTKSEIYCVIDDDQLPLRDDFFSLGVSALENHPEYGMLAGFPLEYGLAGQPYADRTEDVIEAHSIGCPYFVRKGTIKHFPDASLRQYDGELSRVITDQGLKTGFVRQAVYNHLGYGFSQVEHAQ